MEKAPRHLQGPSIREVPWRHHVHRSHSAPVLVAGDSANDFPALFYSAGARVWVRHVYTPPHALDDAMKTYQRAADPKRGWVHGTWDVTK